MKTFEITEEERDEALKLLKSRSYLALRNALTQLKEINVDYKKFFENIKFLVRDSGKTTMVSIKDIEKLIIEVKRE